MYLVVCGQNNNYKGFVCCKKINLLELFLSIEEKTRSETRICRNCIQERTGRYFLYEFERIP